MSREARPQNVPVPLLDLLLPELGIRTPYGVYVWDLEEANAKRNQNGDPWYAISNELSFYAAWSSII